MLKYTNSDVVLSPEYFFKINLSPRLNILGHTWFLFALFEMFLLAIILDKCRRLKYLWFSITSILVVVNCFGITNKFLAIGDLMKNGIFFWLGLMIGNYNLKNILQILKNNQFFWIIVVNVAIMSLIWGFFPKMSINTFLLGVSILFLFCLIQSQFNIKNKKEDTISEYVPEQEITEEQLRQTVITLYFLDSDTYKIVPEARQIDAKKLVIDPYKVLVNLLIEGPKNEKLKKSKK